MAAEAGLVPPRRAPAVGKARAGAGAGLGDSRDAPPPVPPQPPLLPPPPPPAIRGTEVFMLCNVEVWRIGH